MVVKRGHTIVKIYLTPYRGCEAFTVVHYIRARNVFAQLSRIWGWQKLKRKRSRISFQPGSWMCWRVDAALEEVDPKADFEWKHNALRHSFISYRVAGHSECCSGGIGSGELAADGVFQIPGNRATGGCGGVVWDYAGGGDRGKDSEGDSCRPKNRAATN
jgi:hypothetical protein